jgi:biotin transport system substrate-specific component
MTLVDALWPRASTAQDVVRAAILVVGFSALMALSARVAIPLPFTPVPFTLQPLAVVLTGALLGSRLGALALLAYLAEGLAGLPVFSAGRSAWTPVPPVGLPLIIGPTAGYLLIYPLTAFVVGFLIERGWGRHYARALVVMLIGMVTIYIGGALWLTLSYLGLHVMLAGTTAMMRTTDPLAALSLAIAQGVAPFVVWDALKAAIAAAVLPSGWALLGRRPR